MEETIYKTIYQQNLNYQLTEEQRRKLDEMDKMKDEELGFRPIEDFYKEMKKMYGV